MERLEELQVIEDLTENLLKGAISKRISVIGLKTIILTLTKYVIDLEGITIEEYIETLNTFAEENYF